MDENARTEHERDARQRVPRQGRASELHAAAQNQQRRLSQALEHSAELLAASEKQADRLVAALEHAAVDVAPERARTEASTRRAQVLQRQAEHAKEAREQIVAAAGALAAIAEEVARLRQHPETRDHHRETHRPSEYYLGLAPGMDREVQGQPLSVGTPR